MIVPGLRRHPLLRGYAWDDPELVPIRKGGSTGRVGYFGPTRTNSDGTPKWHHGVDIVAPIGWPVFACMGGVIERCGWENEHDRTQGFGLRIWLRGSDDWTWSVAAHLSEIVSSVGDTVRPGDLIGRVGRTGNVGGMTETHLHWEVHEGGQRIDPLSWLAMKHLG